ncbi:MAG: hypothetical protein HC804_00145 [Anaerolineae bacterium]|nr:hypothetical protein [Anaerolineae bacterium]
MKGEVIIPFVSTAGGIKYRPKVGEVLILPPNVDWVQAGFVRVIEEEPPAPKAKSTKKVSDGS